MKSVLVVGANGMLGYAVSEYFKFSNYRVESITRKQFDIANDNIEQLESVVKNVDFAVNCAGIINTRTSEFSVEEVLKVNSVFPRNLARLCKKFQKFCFHITTDCAFSGKRGLYTETDYFDAQDVYGLSKCGGETPDCMTLRTSIIGEEKDASRSLLEWAKSQKGKTVSGFTNHLWNGVTTVYLAQIIEDILSLKLYEGGIFHVFSNQTLYEGGIFHVFSNEIVSKYELLSMINQIYDLGITINRFETPQSCNRSLSSEKDLCGKVVKISLREQIEQMNKFFEGIRK